MHGNEWPGEAGTYALVMVAAQPQEMSVGRLGRVCLPCGFWVYLGSAHGPGGLRGRLGRHLRAEKPLRWHVDYLTARLPVVQVVALVSAANLECAWTRRLLALPGASAPVRGFGSSDCRRGCPAHLVHLATEFELATLGEMLRNDGGDTVISESFIR